MVMILLAFPSCFPVFFFDKDQIASFQSKQIILFFFLVFLTKCSCVHLFFIRPSTKPRLDRLDWIGLRIRSDSGSNRIGLVFSLLVQKNYFEKSCF